MEDNMIMEAEAAFSLSEILECDAYKVFDVAPYVLTGALVHANLKAEDKVTISQVKSAIESFLKTPLE
jgi:hypothetical protein